MHDPAGQAVRALCLFGSRLAQYAGEEHCQRSTGELPDLRIYRWLLTGLRPLKDVSLCNQLLTCVNQSRKSWDLMSDSHLRCRFCHLASIEWDAESTEYNGNRMIFACRPRLEGYRPMLSISRLHFERLGLMVSLLCLETNL